MNHRARLGMAVSLCTLAVVAPRLPAREATGYSIGLSMYSLRQLFQAGKLDPLDYPAFAKQTFGITSVDVWYGGLPKDQVGNPDYYRRLRERAAAAGVDIFLLMSGTLDVRSGDPAVLNKQAEKFFEDVDRAALLGARFLRVFVKAAAGHRDAALQNAVTAVRVLADHAHGKGITLVIEPGGSVWTKDGRFLADIAKAINHPACRLMPDFGKMLGADPYGGTAAMMPYTAVVSAKTHDIDEEGQTRDFDYPRLMQIVTDAGFTGIVAIEYEGRNLGPVDGVKATRKILHDLNK